MQSENRIFDDFARMAQGAFNALSGARSEFEGVMRQQLEHLVSTMNLVTREEFDAVEAMAAKAREAEEALSLRVTALEEELAALKGGKDAPRSRAKPAKDGSAEA